MSQVKLDKLTWCDASSRVVGIQRMLNFVSNRKTDAEVHIGCDSHFVGNKCIFAIVVALYEKGRGGTYFFARIKNERKTNLNLRMRLLKEAELSIQLAELLVDNCLTKREDMHVHLDINPKKEFKSNVVFTPATSWVKSLGYNCIVKPDSWASSWLADAYAK